MAEMRWTKAQEQVIKARNRSLLVSAAAGSGKTAVLVERIIQMVTDPEHPVDIDRLLVMTFTNAAAAEMRERIGDALEAKLEQNPGDRNLERQTTLLHHAKITTIDSFCLHLLREHFNELDIDPGFRIGDEGELLLLQADVMKELLEDYYGRNDEEFFRFADTYARYLDTFFVMYKKDAQFREKIQSSKGFCLHHFGDLCAQADFALNDKEKQEFFPAMFTLMETNMNRLFEDVSWLVDKFDYRNKDADWKTSKDAIQRGMQKLKGGYPADPVYKMSK